MVEIKNASGEEGLVSSVLKQIETRIYNKDTNIGALAFAFLVYDFDNPEIRQIISKNHYLEALDYISGDLLDIFYINSNYISSQSEKAEKSNVTFIQLSMHEIQSSKHLSPREFAKELINKDTIPSPSIIFFKADSDMVKEFVIYSIDKPNFEGSFLELKNIIHKSVSVLSAIEPENKINRNEIFNQLKENIDSSTFWKKTSRTIEKAFSLKSYLTFFKI